jgi:hypothetical protein
MHPVFLKQGEIKLIVGIRSEKSPLDKWVKIHLHKKGGHFIGDRDWEQFNKLVSQFFKT